MIGHANRGRALELAVEQANAQYIAQGVATIQKVSVPTKVLPDRRTGAVRTIREKSTVDYIGVWQGRALAFDCKENKRATLFPLDNVHDHQVGFLANWERDGGIGFLLILHEPDQSVRLVPYLVLGAYWLDWKQGTGRASIPAWDLITLPKVRPGRGCTLDYLAALETCLVSPDRTGTGERDARVSADHG